MKKSVAVLLMLLVFVHLYAYGGQSEGDYVWLDGLTTGQLAEPDRAIHERLVAVADESPDKDDLGDPVGQERFLDAGEVIDESIIIGEWVYENTNDDSAKREVYTFEADGTGRYEVLDVTENTVSSPQYMEYELHLNGNTGDCLGMVHVVLYGLRTWIGDYDLYRDESGTYFKKYLRDDCYYKTE